MQPLISIIVPVYNGQDYLENCIESIETDDDEDEPFFVISFIGYMSNITVIRFKSLEELEEERKQKMLKN